MLVDVNLLLYAVDSQSPHHRDASQWLGEQLAGTRRVGIPWAALTAFVRLTTHQRVTTECLDPSTAWAQVEGWLACDAVWIPQPTERHAAILGDLVRRHHVRGNLVGDAHLAALAIEHGLTVYSADTDFARFTEIRWVNPIAPPPKEAGRHAR